MPRKIPLIYLFISFFYFTSAFSHIPPKLEEKNISLDQNKTDKKNENIDPNKVSEAFGHLIGKNLESLGFDFDIEKIIKGLEDSVAGKTPPMTETQCVQAISYVQEEAFQKTAEKNLIEADLFLEKNANKKGIIVKNDGKLQYKILKKGHGKKVEPQDSPTIQYKGSFLDGKVFGQSEEKELINLEDTIPGFKDGIIGMEEGESRQLYIHPSLGYGTSGYLPPNSMLIFEIELIQANNNHKQKELSTMSDENTRDIEIPSSSEQIR